MTLQSTSEHTELSFHYMRVNKKRETLLDFLVRRFRYLDGPAWLEAIQEGRLLVDWQMGQASQILESNQQITYRRPDFLEPPVDPWFEVLYEDECLIAVNKSGDLPTSPSGRYFKHTLVYLVRSHFGWPHLYTLHRLDRETSGVVAFAKSSEFAAQMGALFQTKQIQKRYVAILEGTLPCQEVFVSTPIGNALNTEIRIKQGFNPDGKISATYFIQLEHIGPYSKVEVRPLTGRTHQIRVHASYLGAPVVGDKLYGLENDGFLKWKEEGAAYLQRKKLPLNRHLLHASELRFVHPITQQEIVIHAKEDILMKHVPSLLSGGPDAS